MVSMMSVFTTGRCLRRLIQTVLSTSGTDDNYQGAVSIVNEVKLH